jgi:hypothetical protein
MESSKSKSPAQRRKVTFTEKDRTLLFLLREVPFVTLQDIRAFLYPENRTKSYAKEKVGYLIREGFLTKSFLENGKCIYYLTQLGLETSQFLLRDKPQFDSETRAFYFRKAPLKAPAERPLFIFPNRHLEFRFFTPEKSSSFQFYHSQALLELYHQLQKTRRFASVVWLDKVRNKQESLDLTCNPDFLLTNAFDSAEGRVLIELENSLIREQNLIPKLDNLCRQQADYYLLLCTNEDIFRNLGLKIRGVLSGKPKQGKEAQVFKAQTLGALARSVWIGLWKPSIHNGGQAMKLRTMTLYRYDHDAFDPLGWTDAEEGGRPVIDSKSGRAKRVMQKVPYPYRRPGARELPFETLLNQYQGPFRSALNHILDPKIPERGAGEVAA